MSAKKTIFIRFSGTKHEQHENNRRNVHSQLETICRRNLVNCLGSSGVKTQSEPTLYHLASDWWVGNQKNIVEGPKQWLGYLKPLTPVAMIF
jgi:hypothetical protein